MTKDIIARIMKKFTQAVEGFQKKDAEIRHELDELYKSEVRRSEQEQLKAVEERIKGL